MAYNDLSSCPRSQISETSRQAGPFPTLEACQAYFRSVPPYNTCERRECRPAGDSSSTSGGNGNGLVDKSTEAIAKGIAYKSPDAVGVGIIGLGVACLMDPRCTGNDPASVAARQAAEATRIAEQRRREEEAARRAEETKQRLLGESKGSDPNALALLGVEPAPDLQLMTGDESLNASARPNPSSNNAPGGPQNHSAAFNLGFQDASQCYSQNAGPRCAGAPADQQQACLSDYRSGYQVGDKQRQRAMDEAGRVGQQAGASGKPADAASDPRALGPCRTQWIETYNRGYFKGKQAKVAR